jgi:hypothetical protein
MKAVKILVLSVLFVLTLGLFSTTSAYTENPPNTYSVIVHENGKTVEYIYSTVDGGVVQINIRNND